MSTPERPQSGQSGQPAPPASPKIRHFDPGQSGSPNHPKVVPSVSMVNQIPSASAKTQGDAGGQTPANAASRPSKKIRSIERLATRHDEQWSRTPNATGNGAIHVRTFHCKLTEDALLYMDQNINEWLDEHPQYEVKFVTTSIGDFTGKLKEPQLICQVWV